MKLNLPPWSDTELNIGDRVWGEVNKNGFIALPGEGARSRLMPSELCVPQPGGGIEKVYSSGSKRA